MNGLALLAVALLTTGCDEPRQRFALIATQDPPFENRGIANITTQVEPGSSQQFSFITVGVDEAPTGRYTYGIGAEMVPVLRINAPFSIPKPDVERRLDEMERKLDRILKELEGLKGRPRSSNLGTFPAFW